MLKKEQRGITLVALVITIIVLLILAGVSLNGIFGESGIINNAQKAKENSAISNEKELIIHANTLAATKSKTGEITVAEMQEAINETSGKETATALNNGETIAIKFKESNRYYFVDQNANIEGPINIVLDSTPGELDGTGTEEDPFVIMSIEDLVYFSQQVYSGQYYSGKNVVLGKTLDFKSDLSYINPETTDYDIYLGGEGETGLKEQLTRGKGFRPIGQYTQNNRLNCFKGNFDGNNNSIKDIKIDVEKKAGLFMEVDTVNISNLTITGNINSKTEEAGGICGRINGNVKIENVINKCNVTTTGGAYSHAGGIAGACRYGGNSIKNCTNYGNITTKHGYSAVGGIVGLNGGNLSLTNVCNVGTLQSSSTTGMAYGGVGGFIGSDSPYHTTSKDTKVYNSFNIGKIEGQKGGGLFGDFGDIMNLTIYNSYNFIETHFQESSIVYRVRNANTIFNNVYYTATSLAKIGNNLITTNNVEQMVEETTKSESFVNKLNTNIENGCSYEQKNDEGEVDIITIDTTGWAKWVYNEGDYPTLDTSTIWNAKAKAWEKK